MFIFIPFFWGVYIFKNSPQKKASFIIILNNFNPKCYFFSWNRFFPLPLFALWEKKYFQKGNGGKWFFQILFFILLKSRDPNFSITFQISRITSSFVETLAARSDSVHWSRGAANYDVHRDTSAKESY